MQTTMTLPTAACQFAGGAATLSSPTTQFGAAPAMPIEQARELVRAQVAAWPRDATHRAVVRTFAGPAPAAPPARPAVTPEAIRQYRSTNPGASYEQAFARLQAGFGR